MLATIKEKTPRGRLRVDLNSKPESRGDEMTYKRMAVSTADHWNQPSNHAVAWINTETIQK